MRKLLLTSVTGPFGVDDAFGRKDNKMELMHNQVTREQGVFSFRFNHPSFGLHFLAENVLTPATVLDYPTGAAFCAEVARGYEYVGISFIIPNFLKAQHMARKIRELSPGSKIILGGHGTAIPDIEKLIDHDYICRGEGIQFLRGLLGEPLDRPIRHPVMNSSYNRKVMGVPIPESSAILVPGVGCPNKCRFCATSHFFGEYTPYLKTGREVFDVCCRSQDEMGVTDFGVLDENFLKMPERALELMELQESSGRQFTFAIFSSAETLAALGDLDLLVRMGVNFIWMGVESKKEMYDKNRGVDFKNLIVELRQRGIAVMASAILFLEHHDRVTITDDIDFAIGLNPDYLQFMGLGPIPGTKLYEDYAGQGKLLKDIPWEDQHGQDRIWFDHPSFTRDESRQVLVDAFKRDYVENGASFMRTMQTTLNGLTYTTRHEDPRVRARSEAFRARALELRLFLPAAAMLSKNPVTSAQVVELRRQYGELFGAVTAKERIMSGAVAACATWDRLHNAIFGDVRQPPAATVNYRQAENCAPAGKKPFKAVNPALARAGISASAAILP